MEKNKKLEILESAILANVYVKKMERLLNDNDINYCFEAEDLLSVCKEHYKLIDTKLTKLYHLLLLRDKGDEVN